MSNEGILSVLKCYQGGAAHGARQKAMIGLIAPVKFAAPRLNRKGGLTEQADLSIFNGVKVD
jgi:hypothetical protein